ncbi:hypothetical protein ABIB57_004255 [Devosia sp. UYZn731]
MPSFTVPAAGRDPRKPELNLTEASEMAQAGFRFSIFSPEASEFQLSRPWQLAQDMTQHTLTFVQDDGRNRFR